jgi:hypothetical protein
VRQSLLKSVSSSSPQFQFIATGPGVLPLALDDPNKLIDGTLRKTWVVPLASQDNSKTSTRSALVSPIV